MTMLGSSGIPGITHFSLRPLAFRPFIAPKSMRLNRRQSARLSVRDLIKYSALGENPENLCNLLDLSETGLRFVSKIPLKANTLFSITMNLAEKGRQIPLTGRIMWCRKMKNELWYAGVLFEEMNREDHAFLQAFIKDRLCKKPS